MSTKTVTLIVCDSCKSAEKLGRMSTLALRAHLKKFGWFNEGNRDVCPDCRKPQLVEGNNESEAR